MVDQISKFVINDIHRSIQITSEVNFEFISAGLSFKTNDRYA